ncbi:hypothetical protein [Rhizosaccharibacter radicis]|uniref:Uncharacterized protein n=1 Tax=Rhizosaccharibacter radicis TaxID=2782605 RepID=A0ABT1VXQ2_9PROT|nr:hypothetical protein [Acetobacteraceae bacterium KSS12]
MTAGRVFDVVLMVLGYLAIQTLVVVAHEHVHSVTAWLLGYMPTPFTVVWGNPLTIRGWDEGVPYDLLFPAPGHPAEAAIGAMPLLMHAILVSAGLAILVRCPAPRHGRGLLLLYWLVVVNLGELLSYVVMRPFIPTGDTGRFAEGLDISPWFLFVGGLLFLAVALWVLSRRVTPMLGLYVGGDGAGRLAVIVATAFVMFLWMSGLRMMALFPDPLWKNGLLGIVGFTGWILMHWRGPVPAGRRVVRPGE